MFISIGHRPGLSALSPTPFGRSTQRCLAKSAATDVREDAAETARSGDTITKGGESYGTLIYIDIKGKYFWMLLLVV